jgi:6-phosphogluconolactonase
MIKNILIFTALLFIFGSCKNEKSVSESEIYNFYVGTYTQKEGHVDGKGEGVYKIAIDMSTDTMKIVNTITDFINPSFLAIANDKKHLYVVNELGPNPDNYKARISHVSIDSLGKHRKSQEAGVYGLAACHVALNKKGNMFAVTNYIGGELAYGKIGGNGFIDGDVRNIQCVGKSTNTARQESSHLHMAAFTSDGTRLLTADLGSDSIRVYAVDEANTDIKKIAANGVKSGDGPRHFTLSQDEKTLYVLNELVSTVSSYSFDVANGKMNLLSTASSLPADFTTENSGAEIQLSNDGKFLYTSNRGHNSIALFELDGKGAMKLIANTKTEGNTPRHFAITADGKYMIVANQDSSNIVVFTISKDGKLTKKAIYNVKTPVCLVEIKK